jgi:7-cyano-7-deazaguanine synthase
VPSRNALILDVAVAVAVTAGCDSVAFGAHGGDHVIYPDRPPELGRRVLLIKDSWLLDSAS